MSKPEKISIREFSDSDYNQLMELWIHLGLSRPERGDDLQIIRRTLDRGGKLLLAEHESKVIATAWITNNGRRLYLHHMGVAEQYQRQGVGKMLMKEVNAFASQQKMQIKLEVHQSNLGARRLYKEFGFKLLDGYDVFIRREV